MSEPRYLCSPAALREMLDSPTIEEDRKAVIRQEIADRASNAPISAEARYVATFDSLHPLRGVVVDEQADRYCTFPTLERAQRAAESWNQPPLVDFDPPMIWRNVVTGKRIDAEIRCDYCGDPLLSVEHRSQVPTTPDLQRLGFSADKVVCPECVDRETRRRDA
jgi:hypothetical protein